MKKKILKNVAILTFALFGLGIIGHNVSYATEPIHEGPGDGGTNPGNLYQSMSRCGSWFKFHLCCTTTERAYLCTKYACMC